MLAPVVIIFVLDINIIGNNTEITITGYGIITFIHFILQLIACTVNRKLMNVISNNEMDVYFTRGGQYISSVMPYHPCIQIMII